MTKVKDRTGQVVGKLTVLRRAEDSQGIRRRVQWLCKCECGELVYVLGERLTNLTTRSCGCLKVQSNAKVSDLIGKRFGRLVVIAITEKRHPGGNLWLCRCDCGTETLAKTSVLNNKSKQSCGCLQREKVAARAKELLGQNFGRLLVLEKMQKRHLGRIIWKCECDCGNITYVSSNCLRMGTTRSCGCLQKITASWRTYKQYMPASVNKEQHFTNLTK